MGGCQLLPRGRVKWDAQKACRPEQQCLSFSSLCQSSEGLSAEPPRMEAADAADPTPCRIKEMKMCN